MKVDETDKVFVLVYRMEYSDDLGIVHYRAPKMHPEPEEILRKHLGMEDVDDDDSEARKVYVEIHVEVAHVSAGLAEVLGVTQTKRTRRDRRGT